MKVLAILRSNLWFIDAAVVLNLPLIHWHNWLTDWFLGVVFVHRDIIEKLTRPLDHKQVFVNFNVFYVTFNCETVDFD